MAQQLRLPLPLVPPLGLAATVGISQAATVVPSVAPAAPWLLLVSAVTGVVLARRRLLSQRLTLWPAMAASCVYLCLVAPVALHGEATLAGYGQDTTSSIHVAGAAHLVDSGRSFSDIAPSSYATELKGYFANAYPSGAHTVLGSVGKLTGQDLLLSYQPYMAVLVALLAPVLYFFGRLASVSRPVSAVIAFVASQPALVYAYAVQGSLKELAALPLIALTVALTVLYVDTQNWKPRAIVPLAVTVAGGMGVVGLGYLAWGAPALAVLVIWTLRMRPRASIGILGVSALLFGAVVACLTLPTVIDSTRFLRSGVTVLVTQSENGNLVRPLRWYQMFGTWLAGDYRGNPDSQGSATYVFIGLTVVAAGLGVGWLLRRRAYPVLLYPATSIFAWACITTRGSPWVDGKVLMVVSPAIVFVALCGTAGMAQEGLGVEALLLAAAVTVGVLWSNATIYHATPLADEHRFAELRQIGESNAGKGPILIPEFEDYTLWYLRDSRPYGPGFSYSKLGQVRNGVRPKYGTSYDLDELPLWYVERANEILLRRSPVASRPPANYALVEAHRFYEVWRKVRLGWRVVAHVPSGENGMAGARIACSEIKRVATDARRDRGMLAYVARELGPTILPAQARTSGNWAGQLGPRIGLNGPGRLDANIEAGVPGAYEVWVNGAFQRGVHVYADGATVGWVHDG